MLYQSACLQLELASSPLQQTCPLLIRQVVSLCLSAEGTCLVPSAAILSSADLPSCINYCLYVLPVVLPVGLPVSLPVGPPVGLQLELASSPLQPTCPLLICPVV